MLAYGAYAADKMRRSFARQEAAASDDMQPADFTVCAVCFYRSRPLAPDP